jgi:hypothetical protein
LIWTARVHGVGTRRSYPDRGIGFLLCFRFLDALRVFIIFSGLYNKKPARCLFGQVVLTGLCFTGASEKPELRESVWFSSPSLHRSGTTLSVSFPKVEQTKDYF